MKNTRPRQHVAGQRWGDGSVRIWDPATGEQRAALTGHAGAADGRTLRSILRPSSGTKSSAERRTLGRKVHPTAKP
jgi:hypothetical protein